MFKKEFCPELNWFNNFNILIDLGYMGFDKNYNYKNIYIPHKKPNRSKNNPDIELTKLQKDENREMSKNRIIVENAIGGMKRYNCLTNIFRNHISYVKGLTILLAAGLWNFNVLNRI